MKIIIGSLVATSILSALFIALPRISVEFQGTPQANADADKVYIGGYVNRVDDLERGVTCYTTGPSGIDCLRTMPKD